MAGKRVLQRLLRLRELEEEQERMLLELSVGERNRVRDWVEAARGREAHGRSSFAAGIEEGNAASRCGGILEMEVARQRVSQVQPLLAKAEDAVALQRALFLERRLGRQQVETLVREQRLAEETETGRRAQQMLDDWFGRRTIRSGQRSGAKAEAQGKALESVGD